MLPVAAHSTDELDDWIDGWTVEAVEIGESLGWVGAWTDMATRHPRYFNRPVAHIHRSANTRIRTANLAVGVEQWRSLVATYFRPADVDRAMRIMACESRGNPNAKNPGSSASGLFQHLGKYWVRRSAAAGYDGASIFNPTANIAVAAWLRDQPGGWLHWECR